MPRKKTPNAPHSWGLKTWPSDVFPNDTNRARHLIRANKDELIKAGALSRVGRELIVLGDRYSRWLELKSANVPGYVPAPNRNRSAA